ncbi:MAG TPA: hypothetical protein VL651_13680 [Bacteroidia bacterium]|jgi:hypothetical protein|nr:hypothetical protein [Bacteroidia bacterium]
MRNSGNLTFEERELLLKYPAFISMLAANDHAHLDKMERKEAIHFSHIKTFSCDPRLSEFYREADHVFEKNIEELEETLPADSSAREKVIREELAKLDAILNKLGKEYALLMHKSMKTFKDHVSKAHNNVLDYFVFPLPIKGISE